MTKNRAQRLDFGLLLLFYKNRGRFPVESAEIDPEVAEQVAHQLGVPVSRDAINTAIRTGARHRTEIRTFFGFRKASVVDAKTLTAWLCEQAAMVGTVHDRLMSVLEGRCLELLIEPPSVDRMDRIVRDAINDHDERFCNEVASHLTPLMRERLEALLEADGGGGHDSGIGEPSVSAPALLLRLRGDPGRPSLAGVQAELAKLELVRRVELPAHLFKQALPHELERYRQRVSVEAPHELRRHPEAARLTWLAAFVHLRSRQLADNLVDLLIETIHHIGAHAERRVDHELLDDLRRVRGKQNLLFEVAGAALDQPNGIVREVVFPVVGEPTLRDLVKEWKATGPTYRTTLRTVIRNSYKGHYRRMVPQILETLDFRSNNQLHRPVIQALDLVKRYASTKLRTFPADEEAPIDGVARPLARGGRRERRRGAVTRQSDYL